MPPSFHFLTGKRLFFEDGASSASARSPMSGPRRFSRIPDLANRGEDDNDDSDEDIVMAPKSLAATFDYFSDSD